MSFFKDPELFLTYEATQIKLLKIFTKFGDPFKFGAIAPIGEVMFSVHLSSGNNKLSDFDTFFGYLSRNPNKYVNCQGLVIKWAYNDVERKNVTHTWSAEKLNLSLFGLPAAPVDPCANEKELAEKLAADVEERNQEKQVLEKRISDLETTNAALMDEAKKVENEKNDLVKNLDAEKAERLILQTTIASLEAKISTLQEKIICDLKAENSTLEGEVERMRNEKSGLIKDLEEEKAKVLIQEKTISDLKEENSTLAGEVERVKNEKEAVMKDLDGEKANGLALEKTILELKDEIAALEDKNNELNEDLDKWTHEISHVHSKLSRKKA
ncbi:hypothetical protein MKW98_030851 [Papaver atlanticum]|uniref:Uncharacterized protein n=1 Tax=Papaver atlanticum TaxID=357466 RepID=A0AAD4X765_9MAGN|nr:hypothetical protein MKW98_030851 [Papaver atlanticum]